MAQWNRTSQNYLNDNTSLFEASLAVDEYGNPVKTSSASAVSAFGEHVSVPITPVFQLDGLYGLDERLFESYESESGSAIASNTLLECRTGTSLGGYGVIRSKRSVRYRPGQGALTRFTAQFTEGAIGYTQRAGFFAQEQAIQVGFDGDKFGVLLQNKGKAHIHNIVISNSVTISGNITVTLNDEDFVIAVLAGDTVNDVARKIHHAIISDFWILEYAVDKVCFLSTGVGPKTGTFSFSDTDSTGVTATLSVLQGGVNHINNWTYQEDFNGDTLDGNGFSGATLNPTKLNVFQINFRWLGAGQIRFSIENPLNGDMIVFHEIKYANNYDDVHVDNPSLKVGWIAASLGGTGTDIYVSGGSMLGAIEGLIENTKLPTAASITYDENPNLSADDYHHVLTLHNRLIYKNKINTREVLLKTVNAAFKTNPSGTPVLVAIYYNFNELPELEYKTRSEENSSVYYSDTIGNVSTEVDSNLPIYMFEIPGGGSSSINLEDLRIVVPPNSSISFVAQSTESLARVSLAAVWVED